MDGRYNTIPDLVRLVNGNGMQSARPVPAAAPAAGPAAAAKSPAELARETLRLLATRKLAPTPDNYQRLYEELSGIQSQSDDGVLEPLLLALRDLPKSDAALKDPAARMQRALVGRNWKAFSAEIVAITSSAATSPESTTVPAPGQSAALHSSSVSWPEAIQELLKQYELRHAVVSPRQKREGLDRVLGGFGNSPDLKDKLIALVRSWGSVRSAGTDIAAADAPALDDPAQIPLAASALARMDASTAPAGSGELLRQLLAEVLRNDVAPRFAVAPALNSKLIELSDMAKQADSLESCAALSDGLAEFWQAAGAAEQQDGRMLEDLMGLVRLLVENIGELVDDDQWVGGQVEVMRQIMAQPLTPELVNAAQVRFREIIRHQAALKNSLAEAKNTLKDMIAVFVARLGDISQSTAEYHDKIGVYAQRIEGAEEVDDLRGVLDGLMGDIRTMQSDAARSRDEVVAAREQAQAAEVKIRQLETELEEVSEKVREDALTGSLNRRGLDEVLAREAARSERYGNALCVSVIDLDNFKKLNDTHGHQAGDQALIHLVSVVKSLLRPSDSIGRFGGEEFVVLLPETTLEAGKLALERLQRELTKQFFLSNNEKLLITFSAGVAQYRPGESEADVIKRADQAMYQAKQTGKNRVCIAD
jgi:diguanylate cyclase